MKRWWCGALLLFIVLFGLVIGFNLVKRNIIAKAIQHLPEPQHPVTIVTVQPVTWIPTIEAVGFVKAKNGVLLTNQVAGRVKHINFTSGQAVKRGDFLLELDCSVEYAKLRAAKAHMPATLKTYKRYRCLYNKQTISKAELEEAKANYDTLIANIQTLVRTIALKNIKSPFAGVIGLERIHLGQFLAPGTPIANLQNSSNMYVRFTVPQKYISELRINQPISIKIDAYPQQQFNGSITAIEPVVTSQSGLILIQANINKTNILLREGMLAKIAIELTKQPNQITLPQTAITFNLYGTSAYVIKNDKNGDLRAQQVSLTLGEHQNEMVHVVSGIHVGDRVVTSGQIRLTNGAKVKLVDSQWNTQKPAILPTL